MRDAKAKSTKAYVSDTPQRMMIEIKHRHWRTTASQSRQSQRKEARLGFSSDLVSCLGLSTSCWYTLHQTKHMSLCAESEEVIQNNRTVGFL